ncbi:hypothetical protein P4361_08040 [Fictibacillus sp. B-59209]|uniref:hypothetical protein n=1 Tax=Fictibacillus sp. B-59209 TaxID=3024873 RepID=UPI002E1BEFE1|nr:hypothetical protein [Fictibacillus sp. B-59209]
MNTDHRLQFTNVHMKKHRADLDKQALFIRRELTEEQWTPLIEWLAYTILNRVNSNKFSAIDAPHVNGLSPTINNALQNLYLAISQDKQRHHDYDSHFMVFDELLGNRLADIVKNDFSVWEELAQIIYYYPRMYNAWKNQLPSEIIKNHEEQLFQLPEHNHPLELVETWGIWRDRQKWSSFDELQLRNFSQARDSWELAELALDYNNEFELTSKLVIRGDLLFRESESTWLRWVASLPLIQMQAAAIEDIRDLDLFENLIKLLLQETKTEDNRHDIVLVLLVRHALGLWDNIYNNLDQLSNNNWIVNEEDRDFKIEKEKELEVWKNKEFPKRVHDLVNQLSIKHNKLGKNTAMTALLNLKVNKKTSSLHQFRTELVNQLSQLNNVPALIKSLLEGHIKQPAILGSILILFASDLTEQQFSEVREKIWAAYKDWLKSEHFSWSTTFEEFSDEHNLAWMLAGLLCSCANPLQELEGLYSFIRTPFEGWRFNSNNFYKSRSRVSHVLIVAAMASEWMIANEQEGTNVFYKFLWNKTHTTVRHMGDDHSDVFDTLLIQVWARLKLVLPFDFVKMAEEAVINLDYLKHIILCLQVLRHNLRMTDAQAELDIGVQKKLQIRFVELFPLIRSRYNSEINEINWYLNEYKKLTPDIDHTEPQ